MRPLVILVLSLACSCYLIFTNENKISISYDKITTLIFEEEIIDAELGSPEYNAKVKGRYLLLRAAKVDAAPTSLFVRYGKKQQHYYVAEIYPDKQAPLQYSIPLQHTNKEISDEQQSPSPFTDTQQEYFDIGVVKNGIKVILNKLLLAEECIWIQLYIENNASRDLHLSKTKFEYVTRVRRGLWSNEEKKRLIEPIIAPDTLVVLAKRGRYVALAVPIAEAKEGLSVCLEGKNKDDVFGFFIPVQVLRMASRN